MEHIMNTIHNRKKLVISALGATAAAVAAPAVLFAGAGTAEASPQLDPYSNNGFGTIAHIYDPANQGSETCYYSSFDPNQPAFFPYGPTPVQLDSNSRADLPILGIPTNTNWLVTVDCGALKPDGSGGLYQQFQRF
jgi:hypothetical protein